MIEQGTQIHITSEENSKIPGYILFWAAAINLARRDAEQGDAAALAWLWSTGALIAEAISRGWRDKVPAWCDKVWDANNEEELWNNDEAD